MFTVITGLVFGLGGAPEYRVYATETHGVCTQKLVDTIATQMASAMATNNLELRVIRTDCMDATALAGFTDGLILIHRDGGALTFSRRIAP
jgi:hypothetical protein